MWVFKPTFSFFMKLKFLLILIVIFIAASILLSDLKFFKVIGTSMYPEITQDDVIIVYPIDAALLKKGDIISYEKQIEGDTFIFTHRIVAINNRIIKTKGDNLSRQDSYDIVREDIVGKVIWKIPYVGYLMRFVHSSIGYLIFIFIPSILLLAREIRNIIKAKRLYIRKG